MLSSRLAAVSLKFAGKSATTRKWYFSAMSRLRVVFRNRLVFVAQIHLDDLLHVLVQVQELVLDLPVCVQMRLLMRRSS